MGYRDAEADRWLWNLGLSSMQLEPTCEVLDEWHEWLVGEKGSAIFNKNRGRHVEHELSRVMAGGKSALTLAWGESFGVPNLMGRGFRERGTHGCISPGAVKTAGTIVI